MTDEDSEYVTAFDLLKEELDQKNIPIITFSQSLDQVLGGGIYFKMITEVFGGKGLGKTTLCLQLALTIQIPRSIGGVEGQCLFIDTENSFILNRINTMATKFADHCGAVSPSSSTGKTNANPKVTVDTLLKGIHYFNCRRVAELEEVIQALDKYLMKNPKIRLIIIDSLAFLFYSESSDFDTRTKIMYTLAQDLRYLMNKFNLAIVVTNNMTTRFGESGQEYHIPYLGESWTFIPNRRVRLEWEGNFRSATLVKCSSSKSTTSQYRIIASGIRD